MRHRATKSTKKNLQKSQIFFGFKSLLSICFVIFVFFVLFVVNMFPRLLVQLCAEHFWTKVKGSKF